MPTPKQIAADWSTTVQYVYKQIKRGCPTDSFEAARLWRGAHACNRAPTSPKQLARIAQEADDDSPKARQRRKEFYETTPEGTPLHSRDLEGALDSAIRASDQASRLLNEAMIEGKDSVIQIRVAIHNKALEGRLKVEAMIQELQEKRKILVPFDAATAIYRRGLDVIMRRLKRLGQEKAAACNPQNPHHALGILDSWVEEMITEVQAQYAPTA